MLHHTTAGIPVCLQSHQKQGVSIMAVPHRPASWKAGKVPSYCATTPWLHMLEFAACIICSQGHNASCVNDSNDDAFKLI